MVKSDHIRFDIQAAVKRAEGLQWDLVRWAREADVSAITLRKWINGDRSIKITTIDEIVRPLGLTAVELILKNGNKKKA